MNTFRRLSGAALVAAGLCAASVAQAQNVQQQGCQLSVFFPINVSTPTASQSAAIANFVRGATTDIIAINGFASDIGSPGANQALSLARASNVGAVVTSTGYQVAAQGFGEAGPGPQYQRTDVVRDDCARETVATATDLGPGVFIAPAGLGAVLLLLGDDSSSSGSTGTGGGGFP